MQPKHTSTDEGQNRHGGIVPHQQRVLGQRHQRLANGVGERGHEVPVRRDQRAHVLGRLCEGEFKAGDGCEDLGEADQHVRHRLRPHVDGREGVARVHVLATCAALVDVVLDDGGADHGERGEDEAEGNALDGRELDVGFAERRVEEVVDDGDEDDEGDGVQVGDEVVGDAVALHGGGLRGEVVVHLVV